MLRFTVLGTTGFDIDGEHIRLGGRRTRAVLACLCAHAGSVVSNDRLLEEAWGGQPPSSGKNALKEQVSQLRIALGPHADAIVTEPPGYRLDIPIGGLDAARYEATVSLADQLAPSNPERASGLLDEAERLWVGTPYADIGDLPFADDERRRLVATQTTARSVRFDVENALGRHDRVLREVDAAIVEDPYDERLWRAKMRANYLAGNQRAALSSYQDLRSALEEIGLDPSAESSHLELAILQQDASLAPPAGRRGSVPVPAHSLVGRNELIDEVRGAISTSQVVTLTGFGGVGKTRIAVEVAGDPTVRGGSWFVDLTAVRHGESVAEAIASAVGLYTPSPDAVWDSLGAWLDEDDRLIILDNCEQIAADAAATAARLASMSTSAHLLCTSRIRLGAHGEHVVHIPPLPTSRMDPGRPDALELLYRRAGDAGVDLDVDDLSGLATLTDILEGHPLAIELAAAQLRFVNVAELTSRLRSALVEQLADPTRITGDRHGALSSVLESSWTLLPPAEQAALARLAFFRSGFTEPAAMRALEGVADAPTAIATLIDASLVEVVRGTPTTRYRMLETVRQFARAVLDADDQRAAMRRHVDLFKELAGELSEQLAGVDQVHARAELVAESANLRAAIEYAVTLEDFDAELAISAAAGIFWFETGQHNVGREVMRRTLEGDLHNADAKLAGEVLRSAAELFAWGGQVPDAYRAAATQMGLAGSDPSMIVDALGTHGVISFVIGRYDDAARSMASLVALSNEHGLGPRPYAHASAAYLELIMGHTETANRHIEAALSEAEDHGETATAAMLDDFRGWRSFQLGDLEDARARWLAAEGAYLTLGMVPMAADMRQLQAWMALELGDTTAVSLLASAQADFRHASLRPYVIRGAILDAAATTVADPGASLGQLEAALREAALTSTRLNLVWGCVYAARCAESLGRTDAAHECRRSAATLAMRVPMVFPAWLEDPLPPGNADDAVDDADDATVTRRALISI